MSQRLGGIVGAVEREAGIVTAKGLRALDRRLSSLEDRLNIVTKNNQLLISHGDLQNLDYADSGHTGFASTTQLALKADKTIQAIAGSGLTGTGTLAADFTFAVGAGTGITVNADDVAVDQGFSPTWSGTHVFSNETTHNGGVDLGTSGRLDSNKVDGAGNSSFLLQPTVAQTSGTDRYTFHVKDQAGNTLVVAKADGSWNFASSAAAGGYISVDASRSESVGIYFALTPTGSGSTIGGVANSAAAGLFETKYTSASTGGVSSVFGGAFTVTTSDTDAKTNVYAGYFFHSRNVADTITNYGGWKVNGTTVGVKGTVTNWHGGYVGAGTIGASRYGLYLEEQTGGGTRNQEIFIAGAGGIWFRDDAINIESTADGHLDLTADTSIDMNGDVDISAKNIITDTGTGTKIGTGNTQKLGFWGATPVARPSAYTPSNVTTDRSYDANATSTDELADVLGTLIADLQSIGIIG